MVLQLGAGLHTGVDPGPGVSGYDVDFPEVIDVRRRLFPRRENYRTIGSSDADVGWLAEVPHDRPMLIVTQGLLSAASLALGCHSRPASSLCWSDRCARRGPSICTPRVTFDGGHR